MPSPLFVVQQWLAPFGNLWLVWALLALLAMLGYRIRNRNGLLFKVSGFLLITLIVLVFGIRGLVLLINPYSEQIIKSNEEVDSSADVAVDFYGGELQITSDAGGQRLTLPEATIICAGCSFELAPGEIKDGFDRDPRSESIRVLKLQQRYGNGNPLTGFYKTAKFTVPSSWQGKQHYKMTEGKLILRLDSMEAPAYQIVIANAEVVVVLPTVSGDKQVTLQGEGRFSGKIIVNKSGPSYRLVDKGYVLKMPSSNFEKVEKGEYLVKGSKVGEITVRILPPRFASARESLELVIVNEDNE